MFEGNKVVSVFMGLAEGLLDGRCQVSEYLDAMELMVDSIEDNETEHGGTTGDAWNDAAWFAMVQLSLQRGTFETNDVMFAARLNSIPQAAAEGGFLVKWEAYEAGVPIEDILA